MESAAADAEPVDNSAVELRERAESLERQIAELQKQSDAKLVRAELKVQALRFGMVDLDGLKLLDLSAAKLNDHGEVEDAAQIMTDLKRTKPWLFMSSSSSAAAAPPAQPPRQKMATEMTDEEYHVARAALLKHRP